MRVLQEGQIERVGEEKTRSVDVRVVAATNRDLKTDVDARRFREDLFFRLNVFPIEAIPLRDRIDDIALLATHFITLICRRLNRPQQNLTRGNLKQLQAYPWPGNIRELQNVIERAIIVSKGNRLNILTALRLSNGKISGANGAAELLGIKPTTLASRMKSLGVEKPE